MKTLSRASQAKVAELRKLTRKKYRQESGKFLIEGLRAVNQLIEHSSLDVEAIYVQEGFSVEGLKSTSVPVFSIEAEVYAEVSDTVSGQGVVAVVKAPEFIGLEALKSKQHILALDGIQDPGNLGTIYRTAAWFDVDALLLGKGTVELYQPKVVRSTVGATGSIPVWSGELDLALSELSKAGFKIYFLDAKEGAIPLSEVNPPQKWILVLGNEGNGINTSLVKQGDQRVIIPGNATVVESLNVGVAGAIALARFTS